jgi:hypothetical protein
MNAAVWKALARFFPQLKDIELADFKVRVLDNNKGTGAKVRVWIRFHDRSRPEAEPWSTLGVSTNIIEASWLALMDGINYKLMQSGPELPGVPAAAGGPATAAATAAAATAAVAAAAPATERSGHGTR